MTDDSFDYVLQFLRKASWGAEQLWDTGARQLPLAELQGPLEVLEQVLKGRLRLAAEGMHDRPGWDSPPLYSLWWGGPSVGVEPGSAKASPEMKGFYERPKMTFIDPSREKLQVMLQSLCFF